MSTQSKPHWYLLLQVLRQRKRGSSASAENAVTHAWPGIRANLRRGASEFTEHYAYPYVLPYLPEDASAKTKKVALMLSALYAEFDKIPEFTGSEEQPRRTVGSWCQLVSLALQKKGAAPTSELDPRKPDTVGSRLAYLHTQDAEEAITTLRRIFSIANSLEKPPAVDYEQVFRTFFYWGDGFSAQSKAVRRKVLEHYYSAFSLINSSEQADSDSHAETSQ